MLRLAWLTIAQHVFQPALTGRLELVSRKIVSRGQRTKAITVSKFREKLSPTNWIQGVTAISRKISRSWAPKNGVQHATAIYPIPRYTRPRYIGLTLYRNCHYENKSHSCLIRWRHNCLILIMGLPIPGMAVLILKWAPIWKCCDGDVEIKLRYRNKCTYMKWQQLNHNLVWEIKVW